MGGPHVHSAVAVPNLVDSLLVQHVCLYVLGVNTRLALTYK